MLLQELYFRDSVAEAARTALGMRYRLLPYLAQAFEQAHNTGTPVARPLWFAFPEDPETHRLDKQWLLGPDILVSPVLDKVQFSSTLPAFCCGNYQPGNSLTGFCKQYVTSKESSISGKLRCRHIVEEGFELPPSLSSFV